MRYEIVFHPPSGADPSSVPDCSSGLQALTEEERQLMGDAAKAPSFWRGWSSVFFFF